MVNLYIKPQKFKMFIQARIPGRAGSQYLLFKSHMDYLENNFQRVLVETWVLFKQSTYSLGIKIL